MFHPNPVGQAKSTMLFAVKKMLHGKYLLWPEIRDGWAGGEQWISWRAVYFSQKKQPFSASHAEIRPKNDDQSDQKEEYIGFVSFKKEQDLILNWSLTMLLPVHTVSSSVSVTRENLYPNRRNELCRSALSNAVLRNFLLSALDQCNEKLNINMSSELFSNIGNKRLKLRGSEQRQTFGFCYHASNWSSPSNVN